MMAMNHDKIREAVESHKRMTGQNVQYHDGGAESSSEKQKKEAMRDQIAMDIHRMNAKRSHTRFY